MKWYYADILKFPKIYLNYGYFWPSHHPGLGKLVKLNKLDSRLLNKIMFDALLEKDWPTNSEEGKEGKEEKGQTYSSLDYTLSSLCEKPREEEKRCEGIIKSGKNKGKQCTIRCKPPAKPGKKKKKVSSVETPAKFIIRAGNFCGTHQKVKIENKTRKRRKRKDDDNQDDCDDQERDKKKVKKSTSQVGDFDYASWLASSFENFRN
jgi:hypothetical protein